MKFRMSPAIAVYSSDPAAGESFYRDVLGFPTAQDGDGGIDAEPLRIFVDSTKRCDGPLLELLVDDLEAARAHLEANGCSIVEWAGRGGACVVEDPNGVRFNVWQEVDAE